jgi:hypothetical protein
VGDVEASAERKGMKQTHTPVPWRITKALDDKHGDFYIRGTQPDQSDIPICVTRHGPEKQNAEFIIKAVNNHDRIVAALKECSALWPITVNFKAFSSEEKAFSNCIKELDAIIAEVEGRKP